MPGALWTSHPACIVITRSLMGSSPGSITQWAAVRRCKGEIRLAPHLWSAPVFSKDTWPVLRIGGSLFLWSVTLSPSKETHLLHFPCHQQSSFPVLRQIEGLAVRTCKSYKWVTILLFKKMQVLQMSGNKSKPTAPAPITCSTSGSRWPASLVGSSLYS